MGSTTDLDLNSIASEDLDQLANKIESFYKGDNSIKSDLAWNWERNAYFLDGKQWLVFDGDRDTGGAWKKLKVSKANEYIPRPVTNYIFDAYQTLKSYLLKSKPKSSVRPNTQQHKDKTSAKLASLVLDCTHERLCEQNNYEYAASCLVLYGTVFKKTYWDTTALSMAKIPKMQVIPKTDPMTGAVIGEEEVQVLDEAGQPEFDHVPLGDVATTVVEPYRIALDPLASDIHNARWIMEYSIQPLQWIKEIYGKQEEGYTGLAETVKEETSLSNSLRRFYNLKTSSGVKGGSGTSSGDGGQDQMLENAAVVKEYYERPCQQYPMGRLVVVANGVVLYSGESPYSGSEWGDWHPYSECRWEIVPGRFWGKSPFDSAVEIQKQINSIDSVMILTRKTMAIPQKLIPLGSGVQPGQWTGRPGQEIHYRESSGAIPQTIPASGVDAQVFQEREQRLGDFKQITGAIDILKGDAPTNISAYSALNLLYEVGTGKLFPTLDRWKKFSETDGKKQLKLVSKKYKEPRPDFIKLLMSKNSELSEEEVSRFIGEDMNDNCNVIIEAGSNIPKLQAAQQALLLELAQTGALALEVPENKMEFLQRMGITGFDNDVGPDVKRAQWENDLLDNMVNSPDNMPVVLACDIHELHKEVHERRMKQPSFMSQPSEVQQAYMMHIQEHDQFIEQAKQQEMLEAMATGQPPMGQEDPNAPQSHQKSGKGVSKELKNNLFSSAMKPGEG